MKTELSFPDKKIREIKGMVFEVLSELAENDNIELEVEDVKFVTDFLIRTNSWYPEEDEIADIWNNLKNGIIYRAADDEFELGWTAILEGMDYPEGIEEDDYKSVGKWILKEYPNEYMITEYGIFVVGDFN